MGVALQPRPDYASPDTTVILAGLTFGKALRWCKLEVLGGAGKTNTALLPPPKPVNHARIEPKIMLQLTAVVAQQRQRSHPQSQTRPKVVVE